MGFVSRILLLSLVVMSAQCLSHFEQKASGGSLVNKNINSVQFGGSSVSFPCHNTKSVNVTYPSQISVNAGSDETFVVQFGGCSPIVDNVAVDAWVDWRHSGEFTEGIDNSGNRALKISGSFAKFIVHVPSSTPLGSYKMRIMVDESAAMPLSPYKSSPSISVVDIDVLVINKVSCPYSQVVGPSYPDDTAIIRVQLDDYIYDPECPSKTQLDDQTDSFVPVLYPGFTFHLKLTMYTCGGVFNGAASVWVDWEGTGLFEDNVNVAGTWTGTCSGVEVSIPIVVPITARGRVRARIMLQEGALLPLSPCATYYYGSAIDISFLIGDAATCAYADQAGPRSGIDSHISKIVANGVVYSPACPGRVYVDDQSAGIIATMLPGEDAIVTVSYGSCGDFFPAIGGIFIDWEKTGRFDQGLVLGQWSGYSGEDVTYTIRVPSTIAAGDYRMRFVMEESAELPANPCAVFDWGSMIDITVRIRAPDTCSYSTPAGPTSSADSHISSVRLDSTLYTAPCPGIINIDDQTAHFVAPIFASGTYDLQVIMSSCASAYNAVASIWVDWASTGNFVEGTGIVGTWSGLANGVLVHFPLQVPVKQRTGTVRARIVLMEAGTLPISPCARFSYGHTIDVTFSVSQPNPASCLATAVVGPSVTQDENVVSLQSGSTFYYPPCPGVAYNDDQTANFQISVSQATPTPLSVVFGTCGLSYSSTGEVWVDWSSSGFFSKSTNSQGTWSSSTLPSTGEFALTVPAGTALGPKRARVIMCGNNECGLPIDPCRNFSYGSLIDFAIIVTA